MKDVMIFAHRGSKGTRPENTMAAFMEAEKSGADGIELDVHLTSDGVPVIIHDETLDRTTTSTGRVEKLTLADIKEVDAGVKFSGEYSGERIPTLKEFFDWIYNKNLLINVELKNDVVAYKELEEKVIRLIREYNLEQRTILSSFNHESIRKLKALAPDIERALLFENLPDDYERLLTEAKEAGFHPKAKGLTAEIVSAAKKQGYKVRPWIANKPEDMKRLAEYGVDVIMTDFPALAVATLRQ
ncbi:glycerophosphodiester phosphodiesterase [Peribacillus sp. SCS-155]|uniref:glycerophosphodiester phosphodiesterase n=1 Tax=Peribacillus sedimenti TaxID=3115297 RepID=UPI003905AB32